jgi:hypothetical protein
VPDFLERLGDELLRAAAPLGADAPAERLGAAPPDGRPARRPRGARWLLAAALAVALAGGGAAIATSGRKSPGAVPPGEEGTLATTPSAADVRTFALLRRPRGEGDEIPQSMPIALSGASGANLDLSRRAAGAGEQGVWVIPGRGSLCVLASWPARGAGGATCVPERDALAGQLFVVAAGERAPGTTFIAGLLPDGVTAVTVHLTSGGSLRVPVRANVYRAAIGAATGSISYAGPRGEVTIPGVGLPAAHG